MTALSTTHAPSTMSPSAAWNALVSDLVAQAAPSIIVSTFAQHNYIYLSRQSVKSMVPDMTFSELAEIIEHLNTKTKMDPVDRILQSGQFVSAVSGRAFDINIASMPHPEGDFLGIKIKCASTEPGCHFPAPDGLDAEKALAVFKASVDRKYQ